MGSILNNPMRYCCLLVFCWSMVVHERCFASVDTVATNPLKVAYIYNIAKFTRWPASVWISPNAPFQLCYYGDNNLSNALQVLQAKEVNGHPITLLKPNEERDFKKCHAFYIDTDERRRYRYLLSLINSKRVLVISNDSPFFDYGGLVNLVEKDQRLRFQVSAKALSETDLIFSSKLLKLAILTGDTR